MKINAATTKTVVMWEMVTTCHQMLQIIQKSVSGMICHCLEKGNNKIIFLVMDVARCTANASWAMVLSMTVAAPGCGTLTICTVLSIGRWRRAMRSTQPPHLLPMATPAMSTQSAVQMEILQKETARQSTASAGMGLVGWRHVWSH